MGERRHKLRLTKRLEVTAKEVTLYTTNLSGTGIQVECPRTRLSQLGDGLESKLLIVVVALPDGGSLKARCRVVYLADWADDLLIGLEFEKFAEGGEQAWQDFVSRASHRISEAATAA